jgi:hypothetical protein
MRVRGQYERRHDARLVARVVDVHEHLCAARMPRGAEWRMMNGNQQRFRLAGLPILGNILQGRHQPLLLSLAWNGAGDEPRVLGDVRIQTDDVGGAREFSPRGEPVGRVCDARASADGRGPAPVPSITDT